MGYRFAVHVNLAVYLNQNGSLCADSVSMQVSLLTPGFICKRHLVDIKKMVKQTLLQKLSERKITTEITNIQNALWTRKNIIQMIYFLLC